MNKYCNNSLKALFENYRPDVLANYITADKTIDDIDISSCLKRKKSFLYHLKTRTINFLIKNCYFLNLKKMINHEMFARNYGYVEKHVQEKIYNVRVLIAGCGLGSFIAESLVRLGCSNLILVDHDTIDVHNLNRQNFIYDNIGHYKSECLKQRLLSINPNIEVECVLEPVSDNNAQSLVERTDIIIDTIDFLSVKGLMALYQACYLQKKTVISSLSAGWGAIAFYIPPSNQTKNWFKEIFNISSIETSDPKEYAYYFKQLINRIQPYLPEEVTNNLIKVFDLMAENKPCPASQLSAGSFAAASLCATLFYRSLADKNIVALPYAMALNMGDVAGHPAFPFA